MLQVCLLFCQWPTWGIITAAMDRTRLTVNHHVDEKYGKLALDSIKKLEGTERWRVIAFPFLKEERGTTTLKQRMADFSNAEYGTAPRKDIEDLTWWMNTDRLTARNNNALLQGQFKVVLFVIRKTCQGLQCQKVYDTAAQHRENLD